MRTLHTACLIAIMIAVAPTVAAADPQPTPPPSATPEAHPTPVELEAQATPAVPEAEPTSEETARPSPTAAPVTVPTVFFDKLTVVVEGKAEVNGTIRLQFQEEGAEPKVITVNVLAKTKAKSITADIWKELSLAAGNAFKVKLDGSKIDIRKSDRKGPQFSLTIVGQTATGVSVSTKR